MLAIGLAVGAAAYTIQSTLLVHLNYEMFHDGWHGRRSWQGFYGLDGAPMIYAFLTYFGFVFLVPRWWRQANPLRHARLSVWSTAVVVFWAGIANMIWPFPQPWGFMLAATISIAVQMASVWIPRASRGRGIE
jgi:hypothetical protein